ncbi:hypothetical protein GQ53DRAFT_818986 [Thozetella sp. PMI_491]|nr:hypothetical protein GQ53DRAFT_818986 [Thozetella sp. PMI_491]
MTQQVTVTYQGQLNLKFLEAFKIGVTGTWSQAKAQSTAKAYQIKLERGECGYFTFVPVGREVCGTMSVSTLNHVGDFFWWCGDPENHIQNFCSVDSKKNPDGTVDGDVIFVRTNCENREPLPMDQQDPIYGKDGVAMPRGELVTLLSTFSNNGPDNDPPPKDPPCKRSRLC